MAEELFEIKIDDTTVFEALDKLEAKLLETAEAGSDTAVEIGKAFELARGFVDGFNEAINEASQEVAKQAEAVKKAKANNDTWSKSIKDLIGGINIGGKSLSEWGQQAKAFSQLITGTGEATTKTGVAFKIFSGILKATGIGLLIGLIGSAISYFSKFQGAIDKASQIMAGLSAVVDETFGRLIKLGSAVGKLFTGDFSGAAESAAQAFDNIGASIVNAATAAYLLEQRVQALRDATITASVEFARQEATLQRLRDVVQDDTQSIGKRIQVQKQAASVEIELARKRFDLALEAQQIEQARTSTREKNEQERKAAAEAEIKLAEAQRDLDSAIFNGEKEARDLRKQASEEAKKASEERKKKLEDERKLLEALANDLKKLRLAALGDGIDADLLAVEQKFDELQKVAAEGVKKFNEIEAKRGLTPEEKAQRQQFADLSVQLEEQRLNAILDVLTEYNEKDIAIEEEQQKRKEALAKNDLDRAKKAIEAEKKLRDEQINLTEQQNEGFLLKLEASGAKESEIAEAKQRLDLFTQAARLNAELEFQQALLSITDKGDTEQIAQIEATIATIQQKINNLGIDGPKKPKSLLEILGIDSKGAEAINAATSQILDSINQISQARIDAAAAEVEAINGRIAAQEEAINREAELAKQGLANDLDVEKARLAELKKQREAAAKEEAKARRAQIALDSIQQVSSLITASANIFKSASSLGPFGVPIAIGLIAAMFGAFVVAKAKALKAASVPKYRQGTKLSGRSHESGGNPILDGNTGEVIGEAEHDEWLIGTGPSREHDRFLGRLNKGEFKGLDLERAVQRAKFTNDTGQAVTRIKEIERKKMTVGESQHWHAMERAYMAGSERIVRAIDGKAEIMPWKGGYKRRVKTGNITNVETVIPKD